MRTQKEMDMSPRKMWEGLYFLNLLPRNMESGYSNWIRLTQINSPDFDNLCVSKKVIFFGV